MARGGKRDGAGGKPSWRHGKTKPIRVPVTLAEKILEIARVLDEEGVGVSEDSEPNKVIDLTGVAILYSQGGPVVRLSDLVRIGYEIKPERLVRNLKVNSGEAFRLEDLLLKQGTSDE